MVLNLTYLTYSNLSRITTAALIQKHQAKQLMKTVNRLQSKKTGSLGSPLRMRGKVCRYREQTGLSGITPAYAGKRVTSQEVAVLRYYHPCVCGEKGPMNTADTLRMGSPLRMRGKVHSSDNPTTDLRITPAYAGKRTLSNVFEALSGDHPCVCGEKSPCPMPLTELSGSPLRMRGKVAALLSST